MACKDGIVNGFPMSMVERSSSIRQRGVEKKNYDEYKSVAIGAVMFI
jgi:hypothetical protein